MKKIFYHKLIRDKIPDKIKKKGSLLKTRKLNQKEFEKELLKKVGEEASGLLNIKNRQELIFELADVQDVLDEVKKFKKISAIQIKNAQKENYQTKGGFKKKIYLVWSADDGYKSNERKN